MASRKKSKQKSPRKRCFEIHNNGDRPYKVCVTGNKAEILKRDKTEYKLVRSYKILKYFIGKSKGDDSLKRADHKKEDAKYFVGNTILLQIGENEYVVITDKIVKFKTDEKIVRYYSSVGRSDVPYPVAEGETKIYFLLSEDMTFVPKSMVPKDEFGYEFAYESYFPLGGLGLSKYAKRI